MEDKKEVENITVVPKAPPPPTVQNKISSNEGKNLMKSAASLIGQGGDVFSKESALSVCENFVRRHKTEECVNIGWSYHNNHVEAFLQDGPTCGLVALKLAADMLKRSQSNSTNEIVDLLKVAQDNGFTYHGEMFSAWDMGSLAKKYYELTFEVINNGLEDYVRILNHLCQGYPVLVPYDADRNHEPCLKKGNKAHWAVITGFLVGFKDDISLTDASTDVDNSVISVDPFQLEDGRISGSFKTKHLFLLARQGKSRHYALWHWDQLKNSNTNLFQFDEDRMSDSSKNKCMFTEGVETGLCSKVVLLFP